VARGLHAARPQPFTVVQLDAHCDLRDTYQGSPYSHACVARRLLDHPWVEQVLQVGIRALCPEEAQFARSHPERVRIWFAEHVHASNWQDELRERIQGRRVFLTLDVDGLDPSVVASTGTPEPDGLSWREGLELLRLVTRHAEVIGFDCVELAPVKGRHASDYAVAKFLYKTMSYIWRARGTPLKRVSVEATI
jgi:agmatinase